MMTTTIEIGYKSDIGRRRDTNEDSCAVLNHKQLNSKLDALLIVGDGLGGRRSGEVASSLLVETVSLGVLESTESLTSTVTAGVVEQLLHDTIVRANGKIMTQGRFHSGSSARGMATTCVTAIVHGSTVTIANVGDSRIYLVRAGSIRQLTQDHSEVFSEFIKGNITELEARNHRFRNQITRAVGLESNVKPDISSVKLIEGDTLLLCSDGLTTEVPDEFVASVLSTAPSAQEACDALVSAALRHGGRDNVTVVVLRYGDFEPTGTFDADYYLAGEPDTDPDQQWRKDADDELSWADDELEPLPSDPAVPSVRAVRPGTPAAAFVRFAPAAIAVLILAVLVEAAMIYNLYHLPAPQVPHVDPDVHTVLHLAANYNAPITIMSTPVMSDILQISSMGNPIVATLNGSLETYLVHEKKLLPMGGLIPNLPKSELASKHGSHGRSHADLYSDPSGNIYYLNPETKCIETYTSTGTRTNQDLGKGSLMAPTKLIVDTSGSIYVIDENHLKVLTVKAEPKSSSHPAGADF